MADLWASSKKMLETAACTASDAGGNSCSGVVHGLATHGSPDIGRSEFEFLFFTTVALVSQPVLVLLSLVWVSHRWSVKGDILTSICIWVHPGEMTTCFIEMND